MNKTWKLLIAIGVVFLLVVIGWEIFQVVSGGRSNFDLSVIEMDRSNLFTENIEKHLTSDRNYQDFIPTSYPTNNFGN